MENKPSLTVINPSTGQPYTAIELADAQVQRTYNQSYGGLPDSRSSGPGRIVTVQKEQDDFSKYLSTGYTIGHDNEEQRAQLQPWTEQLWNSTQKMAGTAVTTFLDGTAGLAAGLINVAVGDRSEGSAYNRFIDNEFSNTMMDWQKKMELALPNYRTKQEEENSFYENMFSATGAANFWGESVLKNLGFAIGAMGAGALTGIGLESALGMAELRTTSKLLEGLSKSIQEGKTLTAAETKIAASLTEEGLAALKNGEVLNELTQTAKAIKSKTAMNQAVSSFVGSIGEGRIESLQNSAEFKKVKADELKKSLDEGEITLDEFVNKTKNLDKEVENYQNALFTANVALLSLSNYSQYKNIFAKSYTPNKLLSNEILNTTEKGLYEVAEKSKFKSFLDYSKQLIKDPLTEMTEEQGQYMLQKAADSYYSMRLDDEANGNVQNFIGSIGKGFAEAYGTEEGWENAFSGFLIGGLGIPTIKKSSNKLGLSVGLAGGMYSEYKEIKNANSKFRKDVDTVNSLLEGNITKQLYDSQVIDNKLESMNKEAVAANDKVTSKTISSMQLANTVDAFINIGKYDDLINKIKDENELTAAEIRKKYSGKVTSQLTGKESTVDYFKDMTDEQVKDYVKRKSEKAVNQAEVLKKIKQDIDIRFGDYPEGAKKDLFLKAAAVQDIDGRITELLTDIKAQTGARFARGINENFTPEMVLYMADLNGLNTPVDLEQFLKKKKGLENYRRLLREYLKYEENNPEQALKFAEKARDLYSLVLQRQAMNDGYFKMADKRYAENAEALANSAAEEQFMGQSSKSIRYKKFYDGNTNEDEEFGFESTIFQVNDGYQDNLTVNGIAKTTGAPITLENARPVTENPNLVDEQGNAAVRTAKNGDKYATYRAVVNGKEVTIEVKNPVEKTQRVDKNINLTFAKGDSNNLYDENGTAYSLEELEQDPSFTSSKQISRETQRQEIYDKVRIATLEKQLKANAALGETIKKQKALIQESIKETEELLKRAKATKSGRIRVTIDGVKTTFKIFELENKLAEFTKTLQELDMQRQDLFEENKKAMRDIEEARTKGFNRAAFNKAALEDIATLQKQIKDIEDSYNNAVATKDRLQEVVDALKALVKIYYPKFKALYKDIYGVDPTTVNALMVEWQTKATPLLRQLNHEQREAAFNLKVEEKALDDLISKVEGIKFYIDSWQKMINSLTKERETFENELARILAARRGKQQGIQEKIAKAYSKEIDATQDVLATEFISPKPSIDDAFKTAGKDVMEDGTPNPNKAQQRWSKAVAKIVLSDGSYSLRVVTADQRPDLFVDAKGNPLPPSMRETALAVILYNNGKPVDGNLQPLGEDAREDELVYNFIPLPDLSTTNYEKFYDAASRPEEAVEMMQKLDELRNTLFERAKAGTNSFLPVTAKSLGLLETTRNSRSVERDLTTAVWDTLLGKDNSKKGEKLSKSRIEIAKATNTEDAINGWGYITVGDKSVKVKNGLAYFITADDVVVPLLSRKLSSAEVETTFDLLLAMTSNNEIALSPEEAEAVKAATPATPKRKSTFISLKTKKKDVAKQKAKKIKGSPRAVWNAKANTWGYYERAKLTKEEAEAARKTKAQTTLTIYDYLRSIIYFGKQSKTEDSLLTGKPSNPQTEIYVADGKLYYYDFSSNRTTSIPFTKEGLEANKESLQTFLANKYHQISNDKLGKKGKHFEVTKVVFDEENNPLYVETSEHNSYFSYLISNKESNGNPRAIEDIPLTTNAVTDENGDLIVRSTYLKYSDNPAAIKETAEGAKKAFTKAPTMKLNPASINPAVKTKAPGLTVEGIEGLKTVLKAAMAKDNFLDANIDELNKEQAVLVAQVEAVIGADNYAEIEESFADELADDEVGAKIKEDGQLEAFETYDAYRRILEKLDSFITPATEVVDEEEIGEEVSPVLKSLLGEDSLEDNIEPEGGQVEETDEKGNIIINIPSEDENYDDDGEQRTVVTGDALIDINKAKAWLAKNLPQVNTKIHDKLIKGIAQGKLTADGLLHLSTAAEEGSEFHEALHAVMLGILTDEELAEVYKEAKALYGEPSEQELAALRKEYPKLSDEELKTVYLDERLAEDFRTFALSGGKEYPTSTLGKIFKTILDAIKSFLNLRPSGAINGMFYDLYNGNYADSKYNVAKVKERILGGYRNSRLSWSVQTKTGVRPVDNVQAAQFTKEVTHAVVGNLFKVLFNDNNSIADIGRMTVAQLDSYIDDAVVRTSKDLEKVPNTTHSEVFKQYAKTPETKNLVKNVVREYIQNDLGINIGLYQEDSMEEGEKIDRDSNAWAKDNSTVHPREGTNAFVKLMVASLPSYVRNENQDMVLERGDLLGLPMLVRPNTVFNHLLSMLHTSTTFDDPNDNNSMLSVLRRNADAVPYLNNLIALLTDEGAIARDKLEANNLITGFQQSMYKTALNYQLWLVNEGDVVSMDPNTENAESRTMEYWRSSLVENLNTASSIIVKPKDASLPRISSKKVKDVLKQVKSSLKENAFNYYMEALDRLGFTFNVTDPSKYTREERQLFIENAKYFVEQLSKEPKDNQDLDLDYVFNKLSAGRLKTLAVLASSKNYEVTDLQHIGPDGKTRYGVSEHNMISMFTEYINSMPVGTPLGELLDITGKYPMLDSNYLRNSYILHNILFAKDDQGVFRRTDVPFKITIIEGARPNEVGAEGKVNTKADKVDRTWMSFNSILKGVFPILRTSDKSLEYAIDLSYKEKNPIFPPGTTNINNKEITDVFMRYLIDELRTGRDLGGALIKNFNKNIGNGVYFFDDIIKDAGISPILPNETVEDYINKNYKDLYVAINDYFAKHDAEVTQRLLDSNLIYRVATSANDYVYLKALDKAVLENFEKETGKSFSKNEEGEVKMLEADFNNLIRSFTVNSLIGNIEQTKMFFGHPAFYKTAVELYKRTSGAIGTKKVAIVDQRMNDFVNSLPRPEADGKIKSNGNFEVIVLQEPETMSSYLPAIEKAIGKKLASKYTNMEEADGQAYMTLPEYREFRLRIGEWGREEEDLYQRVMRGDNIPIASVTRVFNILKAQYYGLTKIGDLTVPVYLKCSVMPLIPTIYKGTNIESIAESMMTNGQGLAIYPSGIKIGALLQENGEFYSMYDDLITDGEYVGNPISLKANVLNLDYRFMGLQVATNNEIKEYTTRGSQPAKIIVSDRYENGVARPITVYRNNEKQALTSEETNELVKDYHATVNKITKLKAEKLLKELGAKEVSPGVYKINNVKSLSSKLKTAARNRNSPDNLIDSLQTKDFEGEIRFKYLLDGVPNRNKVENLLFSLINNTVITQKYNGGARIQAASTGFERSPRTMEESNGKPRFTSNPDLRFYIPGKNGETLPAQVKIAPNKDMLELINKLGGINKVNQILKKLNQLEFDAAGNVVGGTRYNPEAVKELLGDVDPRIFQFIAYRIPTQGMNTIEHFEIAEFLHPIAGEAVHLPSEIVAKSGGDYDIDKLSMYFHYFNKEGQLESDENSYEGTFNKMININKDFLSAPENYADLLMPNDPVILKELAGDEDPVSKTKSLTWGHNLDTAEYYLVGKAGVGIVARHRTHHTLTQQANVTINKVYKGGKGNESEVSSKLNFKGSEDNYSLAGITDSNNKHKIGNIISDFISAFVDVAKDPFIFRINGSTNTADIYMYLIRRGVPIEMAAKFMTQPIVIEFYKKLAGAKSMVSVMNNTNLTNNEVAQELTKTLSDAFKKMGGDASKINPKVFDLADLEKHVGKELSSNLADINFVRSQFQVLEDFMRYSEQANNLRALMDATSDDTVRHKNFNALDNYNKRMDVVRSSAMFDMASVQRIFDNTLVGGFQKAQLLHNVYRDLFNVTENPKIKTALDNLRDYLRSNGVDEESSNRILDKAKNDLIVHAFSINNKFVANDQRLLFLGTNENLSFAQLIAKTLKSPNPKIRKNPFLKNLIPLIENTKSAVKGLKMFNVKLTTFEFNQLVNGFSGLPTDLQKQLGAFILLQSGLDNSSDTWYDKVPVNIMHDVLSAGIEQFTDNIRNFDTDHFMQEFIRNNYKNSDLVPYAGTYRTNGSGINIDKSGVIRLTSPRFKNRLYVKVKAEFPEFANKEKAALAKAAGLETGEYLLFAKREDGTYQLINKKGDRLMKEFRNYTSPSIINANNVAAGRFADKFPNWTEPMLPAVPKNESLPSEGETLENDCNPI